MFTTLRYDSDEVFSRSTEWNGKHIACITCRSKKLKCSGEKDSCRRCERQKIQCHYSASSREQNRRKQKPPRSGRSVRKSQPRYSDLSTNGDLPMQHDSTVLSTPPSSDPDVHGNLPAGHTDDTSYFGAGPSSSLDLAHPHVFLDNHFTLTPAGREFFIADTTIGFEGLLWDQDPMLFTRDSTSPHLENVILDYHQTNQRPSENHPLPHNPVVSTSSIVAIEPPPKAFTICTKSCIQKTIAHLSTLALSSTITLGSVPRNLKTYKIIISVLPSFLQCSSCTINRSHLSLLLLISQHLASSYEIILNILTLRFIELQPTLAGRIRALHQAIARGQVLPPQPNLEPPQNIDGHSTKEQEDDEDGNDSNIRNGAADTSGETVPSNVLYGYEIEPFEEPCMFGGLVTLQLKALMRFLNGLEDIVKKSEKGAIAACETEGQVLLIKGVEKRVIAQLAIFGVCGQIEWE